MKIIIGTDGLGREPNPYPQKEFDLNGREMMGFQCLNFEDSHPPLPVLTAAGQPFSEPGEYEAEKVNQAKKPNTDNWFDTDDMDFYSESPPIRSKRTCKSSK